MNNLGKIDLQSQALQFISLQHELGMAIGLNLHLRPMLRQFFKVCIRRLGLIGISCSVIKEDSDPKIVNNIQKFEFSHYLSIPDQMNHYSHKHITDDPNAFFNSNVTTFHDKDYKQYIHYFHLNKLGYISLHRKKSPLDKNIIQLLKPIFQKLSISCQASLEHEQLLQAIEAKEKAEKIITRQLFHDELTGLANRRMLMNQLIKDIAHTQKHQLLGAILFIDLNRFKSINDTLGHSVGDLVLKAVAEKLKNSVRERDLVTRLSGDEFAILISNVRIRHKDPKRDIEPIVLKIKNAFTEPLTAGEHTLHITPSIGIEFYSNTTTNANTVLRNADTAMYLAKSLGSNNAAFYDKKMSFDLELRLEVEKQLQTAVNKLDQFELFYQAQYSTKGICIGAEALVRWKHPNPAINSPNIFIPIAEETGLMLKLGRWILIEACQHLRRLEDIGLPKDFTKLSVNVSAVQFNQSSFVTDLLEIIKETCINPKLLTIELTESTLIESVSNTVEKMLELKKYGIGISIDDFGTGYSSLAYLNRYPIATLKIDRVFVKNIHLDTGNRAIVNAMLGLGENLNIAVIAEGVETSEELDYLKGMNCNLYQGYYFCHPEPFENLLNQLATVDQY